MTLRENDTQGQLARDWTNHALPLQASASSLCHLFISLTPMVEHNDVLGGEQQPRPDIRLISKLMDESILSNIVCNGRRRELRRRYPLPAVWFSELHCWMLNPMYRTHSEDLKQTYLRKWIRFGPHTWMANLLFSRIRVQISKFISNGRTKNFVLEMSQR